MWLPTPDADGRADAAMAKTTSADVVYDLGAGDGRLPIVAAQKFGATAVGIEYDRDLAALARRNAERAGVAGKVTIIQGDIFKEDFSRATVRDALSPAGPQPAAAAAAPRDEARNARRLARLGHGRVGARRDRSASATSEAFLWIVPARVRRPLDAARRRRILCGRARAHPALPARRRHAHAARQACNRCWARMSKATSSASRSSISTAASAACARGSTAARSRDRCVSPAR